MYDSWALYALIFALVALAAQLLQHGLLDATRRRRERRRRFDSLALPASGATTAALQRRSSRLGRSSFGRYVNRLVLQSGTALSTRTLGLIWVATVLLVSVLSPMPSSWPLRLAAGLAFSTLLLWTSLRFKRARRMAQFGAQLPEVIDVIVRSLRAGHPLAVALNLVAREMPEPAGAEFSLVVDEVSYGRSLSEALENLFERVGNPELKFFVASTAIAHQTGGNLGEILSRLSRMLRDRFRLARRVRALSAEGRFSGYALSILPIALFAIINLVSGSYYAELWTSAAAKPVIAISLGLLLLGNLFIYHLVNFKV